MRMILLIECVILCIVFTLIIMPAQYKDPMVMIMSYPPNVIKRVEQLPQYKGCIKERKKKHIGKKIFGIGVMHNNGVRIDAVALFVRTFLGKYTIETMVPAMMILMIFFNILGWIALLVIGLLVVLEVVVFVVSKTKAGINRNRLCKSNDFRQR